MLGIAQNPSKRIVFKSALYVRAVALSLLGALVFAASATASVQVGGGGEIPAASQAPNGGAPAGTGQEKGAEVTPVGPIQEAPTPEAAPVAPGQETPPPEAVSAGPIPATPAPAEAAPPAVQEKSPEASPAAPVEKTPPAAPAPITETVQETGNLGTGSGPEKAPEVPPPPPTAPQDAVTANVAPATAAPGAPGALIGSQTSTVGGAAEASTVAEGPAVQMTAAQWAGTLRCELSELGGRTGNCSATLLGAQSVLSQLPAGLATSAATLAATTSGAPPGGGHGSSAVGSPPVTPAPGSAPSGVSGGSAMGGSGLSVAGFLTLAGLLLMGAPRAMRRLRLSCWPALTACFVLIPERPG